MMSTTPVKNPLSLLTTDIFKSTAERLHDKHIQQLMKTKDAHMCH